MISGPANEETDEIVIIVVYQIDVLIYLHLPQDLTQYVEIESITSNHDLHVMTIIQTLLMIGITVVVDANERKNQTLYAVM